MKLTSRIIIGKIYKIMFYIQAHKKGIIRMIKKGMIKLKEGP